MPSLGSVHLSVISGLKRSYGDPLQPVRLSPDSGAIFLFGIGQTENRIVCGVIAGFTVLFLVCFRVDVFRRAWLKGAFVLVFLLGLTWTFGFLYLNKESVAMAYIFAALNSLQGFFIFLFHCVQNEKVRKEYRKFIRRHSWLPKCLRCSKLGGGASSSTGSSGMAKERRAGLYGGSNGNQSGGTNSHSTDNSVLSPHGTSVGTNSIVISNNLNNARHTALVQILSRTDLNNASTTMTNHNRLHNVCSATGTPELHQRKSCMQNPCAHIYFGQHGCYSVSPGSGYSYKPFPDTEPNTATLPYIRNLYKNSTNNPNIPKSVSTWGPLHKPLHWKNISFKSCSRDSGHGGSEQEESPRSHMVVTDPGHHLACTTKIRAIRLRYTRIFLNTACGTSSTHNLDTCPYPKPCTVPQEKKHRRIEAQPLGPSHLY
ncbi:hypothetical protein NQ318_015817 [Aromia moschata]|uniref:Uncharacterized protein n=1 Tax=Aromia moschata TaxID=1265417 RepID=A0AAV8YQM4_9CUCU|nr:hypothetical protein NQ318_015817 [Aromia moschata]